MAHAEELAVFNLGSTVILLDPERLGSRIDPEIVDGQTVQIGTEARGRQDVSLSKGAPAKQRSLVLLVGVGLGWVRLHAVIRSLFVMESSDVPNSTDNAKLSEDSDVIELTDDMASAKKLSTQAASDDPPAVEDDFAMPEFRLPGTGSDAPGAAIMGSKRRGRRATPALQTLKLHATDIQRAQAQALAGASEVEAKLQGALTAPSSLAPVAFEEPPWPRNPASFSWRSRPTSRSMTPTSPTRSFWPRPSPLPPPRMPPSPPRSAALDQAMRRTRRTQVMTARTSCAPRR